MRTYRASSLGYSLEALVAPHLGFERVDPPEWLQEKFDEGKEIEPRCIEKLRLYRWVIRTDQDEVNAVGDRQIEVELEVIPGVARVVGHLDGHIVEGHYADYVLRNAVLEVKSMAAKAWNEFEDRKWDAKGLIQKYKWQASALMLATGMPHMMVAWNKETEELSYALTAEPFYTISDIANKLQMAEDHIEKGVVPDGCTDWPCFFYYLHPPKDEVEKADFELENLLDNWLRLDRKEKEAKAAKDEIRTSILALAGDNLAAKVKGECGVTVETYWQNESEYVVKKREGWVSRISGPRAKK